MNKRSEANQARGAARSADRNRKVLDGALALACRFGLRGVTRDAVAAVAGVSGGSVNNAFGTMGALKAAVMREAVAREMLPLVAEGLAGGMEAAKAAPPELKTRALQTLSQ